MTVKKALIIGASRGLGLGLVKELLNDGWHVTATVRNPDNAQPLKALGAVRVEELDIDEQQAIKALSQKLDDEVFDLVFINAGIKGPDDQLSGTPALPTSANCF